MNGFSDQRPWFALAVTGHPSYLKAGAWCYTGHTERIADIPEVADIWHSIQEMLSKRWGSHRISLYCRDDTTGLDHAVRAFAYRYSLPHFPLGLMQDEWGDNAKLRRDLELVSRTHAVLWFGNEESDGDPARLARLLGIPVRIIL